ncbi:MAG: excinuclease ABC subunit UvrC [Ruminococcaceae bacterium]|nr:excinuclease ABC subunit UvrC [Oscillospiraceae bacterium]
MSERLKELRAKAMALPLEPGVYIMKNKDGDIIYIGKAKKLKNRVSSYFGSQNNHTDKVRRMVSQVENFEYIITDSEFEALILECSLIKQNKPKYNILLKDDKGFSFVKITGDKWKKITYALQKDDDNAEYIGPYTNGFYVKQAVEQANLIFKLPTCTRRFPEDFGKARPCLNYHIKRCSAPCTGKVKFSDYNESFLQALDFLKGTGSQSIKKLTEEMYKASENMEFEKAAQLRDRINAIKKLADKQKVIETKVKNQDVIALFSDGCKACFEVFRFDEGKLKYREDYFVDPPDEDAKARAEFIMSFYSTKTDIPRFVTVDGDVEDQELIERYLSEKKGKRVYIAIPQRGQQKSLVDMTRQNAAERVAKTRGAVLGRELSVLEELKELLGLDILPAYIESYDISNTAGDENVAGMIVYENGRPNKSAYKRFKIKGFSGQDDYGSMAEVLTRRFEEYIKLKDSSEEGFARLPDLILLDGGVGQVSAVRPILEKFGLPIPLFGMVKDDKHRTRAIVNEQGEIAINMNRRLFTFISSMQDEVHRFAIGYHRTRRKKSQLGVSLTEIKGIGTERAKALLKHFRTVSNIKNAELEELKAAPKMNDSAALSVYWHFRRKESEGEE